MSFTCILERVPTGVRMGLMMSFVVLGATGGTLLGTRFALERNLESVTRDAVLDDLQEYAAIYSEGQIASLSAMFQAGRHEANLIFRVEDEDGHVLYEKKPDMVQVEDWTSLIRNLKWDKDNIAVLGLQQGKRLYVGRVALPDGNSAYYGKTDLLQKLIYDDVIWQVISAGLIAMALALVPIVWFSLAIARPLEAFARDAREASFGGKDVRLQAPGAVPELQRFAKAFNRGLDRIDTLVAALQSANDQLAHELRTPLTRLKVRLEAMARRGGVDSAALEEAVGEIDRITRLLETILDIRAGQSGVINFRPEVLDVAEMLGEIHELYRPSAEMLGIRLVSEGPVRGVWARVERERFMQVVANLLDNALKFTPAPGMVRMDLAVVGDMAEITVLDTGPGLPEGVDVWQRYQRGSPQNPEVSGVGLGLSLVQMIVQRHGGSCEARNVDPQGAQFTIRLPIHYQTIT